MTTTTTGTVERQSRIGRPPLTNRANLLAAARAHGFDGLTIRVVTRRCGVKYSTFYRHFRGIDALLAALVDDVLADVVVPVRSGWREQIEATTAELARVLRQWPGMPDALAALDGTPAWVETARLVCSDAMSGAGFRLVDVDEGIDKVFAIAQLDPRQISPTAAEDDPAGVTARAIALDCDGLAGRIQRPTGAAVAL